MKGLELENQLPTTNYRKYNFGWPHATRLMENRKYRDNVI